MPVKIFQAGGKEQIGLLEIEINNWLADVKSDVEVKQISTCVCDVADDPKGEWYQHLVVTIWYEDKLAG